MRKPQSKSRMLLLELLLSVFIFSFCVIICAGVFFQASNIARDSRNLTYAVQVAQSAAEAFKVTDTFEELDWLMEGVRQGEDINVIYDANWNVVRHEGAFVLSCSGYFDEGVQLMRVRVLDITDKTETALVDITVSKPAGGVAQ